MIYFDVTKTASARHASGLVRVSHRLGAELGSAAQWVKWGSWNRRMQPDDWYLTAELFSANEHPGFEEFLRAHGGRTAAIFHDAIPLERPHTTWPQSVARHPGYLKLLGQFARVAAVSRHSADVLRGFWQWQGVTPRTPHVTVVTWGSDFDGQPRRAPSPVPPPPVLVAVGILEPRKNQALLLDVCSELWEQGLQFELHLVGRVNPHFGRPLERRIRQLARRHAGLIFHASISDRALAGLLAGARALLFPTLAEGCGLPLLESLWRGLPCVASDLPVLRENAAAGGCLLLPVGDHSAWQEGLHRIITDDTQWLELAAAAGARPLPTWADAAAGVKSWLGQPGR
jgi:glycosyltransferase involved in cell wall biosynthesis